MNLFLHYDQIPINLSAVVPLYIKTCLEHHPGITPIHTFREALGVIAKSLPESENPLKLWIIKTLYERIHYFIKRYF